MFVTLTAGLGNGDIDGDHSLSIHLGNQKTSIHYLGIASGGTVPGDSCICAHH